MPTIDADLERFATDVRQAILLDADVEGAEQMRSEVFTEHLITVLQEAGELEEARPCYHRDRGIEVHGYGVDDEDTLNLIGAIYTGDPDVGSLTRTDAKTAFRRLMAFWERCRDRPYHEQLEESSEAWDMALDIRNHANEIRRLRLFLVTDLRNEAIESLDVHHDGDLEVRRSVWDIQRLFRLETSGHPREPIAVDFVDRFGEPLACLPAGSGQEDYDAFLTVVPGEWLAAIYDEFGARLLELNVRSFLQATGKVNRGIRDTIRNEPGRFLAYNNGISATASEVELEPLRDGGTGIAKIRDLQIVNGGQTTASIHRALLNKEDLSNIAVQAKVTVVAPENLESIVPLISKFANSQNKVNAADLTSNEPFHIDVEKLSRTVWNPVTDGSAQTKWFYERARGQYADEHARQPKGAGQRKWKAIHPPRQKFTKTDLAKYENAWAQLPHEVSKGAQKNFVVFMTGLKERPVKVTPAYFHSVVARAILWKTADEIIRKAGYVGYRANLVAYSIAKLSHGTSQRLDMAEIWERQALDEPTRDALEQLAAMAWDVMVERAPTGINIAEYAKQKRCWEAMKSEPWTPSAALSKNLRQLGRAAATNGTTATPAAADDPAVARCIAMGADAWFAIANWGKQTGGLPEWQRGLSFDIGKRIASNRPPTAKQAQWGNRILDEIERVGFDPRTAA